MLMSETVVENLRVPASNADHSNQMAYWQPNIIPVQMYPVPVAIGPYPIFIHNAAQIENTFPGKIPLYCGICQAYGCKCFYQNATAHFRTQLSDEDKTTFVQISSNSSPALKTQDFSRKTHNSKNLRDVEQQHEYYKNAAVNAYFNYLKLAPTDSVHNKINELSKLAENFNKKLNIDKPKTLSNYETLKNGNFTTTYLQSGQAPIHPSVELSHENDIDIYLHPKSKFNQKIGAHNTRKSYELNANSARYRNNNHKRPKRSQVLCKFGNECKFYKENRCKFYHPVKYENKKTSIDITDYSIDDESEIDFVKENLSSQ